MTVLEPKALFSNQRFLLLLLYSIYVKIVTWNTAMCSTCCLLEKAQTTMLSRDGM